MKTAAASVLALAYGALAQNVVEFPVTKGIPGVQLGTVPSLGRRDTYTHRLINNIAGGGYYAQVQVGNPPQNITMLLDTGSSDAWVLSNKADLCTNKVVQEEYGMKCIDTYNPTKSSTHKMLHPNGFKITYLDNGVASGDYISDDFSIGGTTIKSLQMALVTKAVRNTGILGLGFSASEKAAQKYPNMVDQLSNQGLISKKAFSLYLNDRRTDAGSILFGGIDTDKFIGSLQTLPMLSANGTYSSFEVDFTGLSITWTNGTTLTTNTSILDHPAPAVLDSGTTLSYLPDEMTDIISPALSTAFDPDLRMTLIDCNYLTTERNLRITFRFNSTVTIAVPVYEMVLDVLGNYRIHPSIPFSKSACLFGIQSTAIFEQTGTVKQSNFTLLGDTFLRSAYVVFDLQHYQIGLAQANLNSSRAAVVELNSAATKLPAATGVTAQQTTYTPTTSPITLTPAPEENAASSLRRGSASSPPLAIAEMAVVAAVTGLLALLGGCSLFVV
ncbi:aspartic peptidase domain-containing protein [Podospora australis]|uniref:Aspartic peptidase domain-containing protein n=1 Tax=Podospora australis TaxID=1536484 RepID=A0AAN6X453_9PEZI|nr:aspartic peptidase domain-containing protein [Podospora australis]